MPANYFYLLFSDLQSVDLPIFICQSMSVAPFTILAQCPYYFHINSAFTAKSHLFEINL